MTRADYKAHLEATYIDRYDLHAVMLAQWDAEHGAQPEAAPEPENAQPEGNDVAGE